jgi:putative membrane protein
MKTLIICIDRDNDLGEKAGVLSPIIGRAANLDAAVKLASADPEDSDSNTIFGGINVYDRLTAENRDAEIVSIAGDKMVGILADRKISEQLDDILKELKPQSAILVSDGAEDESVLPIIQSRIKVDSVSRIIVQQHENLESTYYIIKQAFNNPKISSTFFIPIGLAFMIYAISLYLGNPEVAVIFITGAIGFYLLFRGTGLEDALSDFKNSMMSSLQGGKITFVMYLAALILSLIGTVQGAIESWNYFDQAIWSGILIPLMGYVNASIWWYVIAGVLISAGKIIDMRLSHEAIGKRWAHPFFIIAVGIFVWASSTYLLVISDALKGYPVIGSGRQFLFLALLISIIIATIGAWLSAKSAKSFKHSTS